MRWTSAKDRRIITVSTSASSKKAQASTWGGFLGSRLATTTPLLLPLTHSTRVLPKVLVLVPPKHARGLSRGSRAPAEVRKKKQGSTTHPPKCITSHPPIRICNAEAWNLFPGDTREGLGGLGGVVAERTLEGSCKTPRPDLFLLRLLLHQARSVDRPSQTSLVSAWVCICARN